MNYKKLKR